MAKDRKIDLVILGLLAHDDLTGYDIKKRIDGAISFFWKGSFGSIYPALSAMEKDGLVTMRKAMDSGRREKIFYHITEQGTETLKFWLKEDIRNIEVFEEQVRKDLAVLQTYKENLEKVLDQNDHLYYYLTVTFGMETYEAYLKWCDQAKTMLKSYDGGE